MSISIEFESWVWRVFIFIKKTINTLFQFMAKSLFTFSFCFFSWNQFEALCFLCWCMSVFSSFIKILTFFFIWKIFILEIVSIFLLFLFIQSSLFKLNVVYFIWAYISINVLKTCGYLRYNFFSNLLSEILFFLSLFFNFVSIKSMMIKQLLNYTFSSKWF